MSKEKTANQNTAKVGDEVEVLYQRMGDRWYAFSLIDDEVFVGSLTSEEIHNEPAIKAASDEAPARRKNKVHRKVGNS